MEDILIHKSMSPAPDKGSLLSRTLPSISNKCYTTQDLELVFHYVTCTAITLATSKWDESFWQVVVPQESFSHHFLMHGLLSIASLHLAYIRPLDVDRYTSLGVLHYNSAVDFFGAALEANSCPNTASLISCVPLFASISFVMLGTPPSLKTDFLESMLSMVHSLRANHGMLQVVRPLLRATFIDSPFCTESGDKRVLEEDPTTINTKVALETLEWRISEDSGIEFLGTEYFDAVKCLRHSLQHHSHILNWPVLISDGFFQAMVDKKPIAIAILGFYGAILHNLGCGWLIGDNGRTIVLAVLEILPPEWKIVLRWAR